MQIKETFARGILQSIGWTPLVQLERYLDMPDVELLVKLESANPGVSAKDTRSPPSSCARDYTRRVFGVDITTFNVALGLKYCGSGTAFAGS